MIYPIQAVAKPRQTKRDKFLDPPRPCVRKYLNFKEEIERYSVVVPENGAHVIFRIAMPKGWTESQKQDINGTPHQRTPDVDNLLKGLLDAIYTDDACVWDIRVSKFWAFDHSIEIIKES